MGGQWSRPTPGLLFRPILGSWTLKWRRQASLTYRNCLNLIECGLPSLIGPALQRIGSFLNCYTPDPSPTGSCCLFRYTRIGIFYIFCLTNKFFFLYLFQIKRSISFILKSNLSRCNKIFALMIVKIYFSNTFFIIIFFFIIFYKIYILDNLKDVFAIIVEDND